MAEYKIIGNRFEIHELLGQGGMATVYNGLDTLTQTRVAIKLLKPEIVQLDPEIVQRFEREGEALRRLNHPNIVKVLATVQEADAHYVVMEYVGGGDLRILLESYAQDHEMMPIQRILEVGLDLADALTRAHRLKIIHRDIKPANILIAEDGTPRLTDFGVAHFSDATTRMTRTGAIIGSPSYLSPEGCTGGDLDERADIWSFGVVLYEMLTLKRPFDEDSTIALIYAILSKEYEMLEELRPDAPPELINLVNQMLVKDREERISSVRLVGAHIEAILQGRDVPTLPETDSSTSALRDASQERWPYVSGTVDTGEFLPGEKATTRERGLSITQKPTTSTPVQQKRPSRRAVIGITLGLIAIFLLFIIWRAGDTVGLFGDSDNQIVLVEPPVTEGEYMVLVAQMEQVGGEERDVARFIADDLRSVFEEAVQFSSIRIREYPQIIKTDEQALEVAQANNASVIIWGNYDAEGVNIELQVGALTPFPLNPFTRENLETIANVRIRMGNERRETLAASVIATINILHSANADNHNIAVNLVTLDILDPIHPPIIGNSAAAYWHRYLQSYGNNLETALTEIDNGLRLNQHPIYYLGRSLVHQQLRQLDAAEQDIRSAMLVSPEGWLLPQLTLAQHSFFFGDPAETLVLLEDALLAYPDNWFALMLQGGAAALTGDNALAGESLERSIDLLDAYNNFPYYLATGVALRQGRLVDAQSHASAVQELFPDPSSVERFLDAAYNLSVEEDIMAAASSAFGYFLLGQWSEVIAITQAAEQLDRIVLFPDIYILQGVAHCNLGDFAASEESYTKLLSYAPDYTLGYALRLSARRELGNTRGVLADASVILNSDQAEVFRRLIPAIQSGAVNCANFLDFDYSQYLQN